MSKNARSRARARLVQALYQWHVGGQAVSDIENEFRVEHDMKGVDTGYFAAILHEVPANLSTIDGYAEPHLDRSLSALDPVELAILRLGIDELAFHPEVPYRVVINEGVELAKQFGAEQSHKYINGILHKVAHELRRVEVGHR